MRPRANWPVCPPEPTAAPPITSPAPSPTPHAGGLLYTAPHQSPRSPAPRGRRLAPSPPSPQAVRRTGGSVKSPYPPPRRGGLFTDPPGGGAAEPPPPSKAEGAPRACTPGLAPRAPASPPLHFTCPPPRPPVRPPPAAPTGPRPLPGPRSTAGRPSPGAGGRGAAGGAWLVGTGVPGGRPARVTLPGPPPPRSPAMPASLTQRNAATLADPRSLSPEPSGPGRFLHRLTDPIWGVKKPRMQ
ncbi:hypothetical protein N7530_012929 [Penicillium desertorum]|uniref:Uncharacterized protein n=1 Tax=Penicillium desertorum TaxID=1303715 RepID=A0A9X0BFF7_9EURO|nr:hypothetical protein N7530_012929 [Penicillium desertorum]